MSTVREHLDSAAAAFSDMDTTYKATCHAMFAHVMAALHALDQAEAAWRDSGETYRLVPDTVKTEAQA